MKKIVLPVILSATLFLAACSTTWLSTVETYLGVAGPIAIQILEIVALDKGVEVSPATIAKITGDDKALGVLAQSVVNASTQNLPNACSAFNAGLQTFVADVPTIEQIGQLSNPTKQAQIADALALFQSAVAEIETPIAACQTSGASFKTLAAASRVKSPSDFAAQYNKIMARDKATKGYRVHVHNWFVRSLTFGKAK